MRNFIIGVVAAIVIFTIGIHFINHFGWGKSFLRSLGNMIFMGFWNDSYKTLGSPLFWAIAVGIVVIISESESKNMRAGVNVFCAKCDQYLGTANRFDCPCPRCGSNRYTTND